MPAFVPCSQAFHDVVKPLDTAHTYQLRSTPR